MARVGSVAVLVVALASPSAHPSVAGSPPPSIVLILSDDQRWDTLWAMPTVESRLAAQGVTFTEGFVVNPLCCPSRASILTGQYSHSTDVYKNSLPHGGFRAFQDSSTVATWLDAAGYRTALIGKYLNLYNQEPLYVPPGWDRWVAFSDQPPGGAYYDYQLNVDGVLTDFDSEPEDYSTDVLAAEAESFITGTPSDQALFLYFTPYAPHGYPVPAPRHEGTFDDLEPNRPPNYNEEDVSDKPAWVQALPPLTEQEMLDKDLYRQNQFRTLLAVDEAVGRILDALEATARLENTLIVFMGDNGYAFGEHRDGGKNSPYEESIRVPYVVRYDPLVAAPRSDGHLVLNIDLTPTFADLAGIPAPDVEGTSLLPLLADPSSTWRVDFLVEHYVEEVPTFCAVRDEASIYVRYVTFEEELYDLSADPYELQNVAPDPASEATLAARRGRLRQLCSPPPPGMVLPPASVEITSGPSDPTDATSATFEFSASETPSTFTCTLDGGPPQPCGSPTTYSGLGAGPHTFTVQVFDSIGGAGGSASWQWSVVTVGRLVTVQDFRFSPRNAGLKMGQAVRWNATGPSTHTVTDTTGLQLYDSGPLAPGATYLVPFVWAGSYGYHCTIHPQMTALVKLAPTASPPSGNLGTTFTITWGSAPPRSGFVFDVQVRRPGATQWVLWQSEVTETTGTFVPDAGTGSYAFRARVRETPGGASGYSIPVTISVTGTR